GSGGNARIDLRGLGSPRTLVLVNGRRMIASGTGAASSVDLNTIPVSMIKSVEVLKDGASAVYGTDAVAGVVNIILKDDFEGLDMNVN
ncbi:TonB-dependent receptor plug domain-containing protein, partial [Streptomyces turgidiscabies]